MTPAQEKKLAAYEALHDGLSDMIEGGRLTESHIPDDYEWLVESLAGIPEDPEADRAEASERAGAGRRRVRFAVTKAVGHLRSLMHGNQARNFFDTQEKALEWLAAADIPCLAQLSGCSVYSIGVSRIPCYENGDAIITCWMDSDEFTDAGRAAYLNGDLLSDCPHDEGTDAEAGWRLGWLEEDCRGSTKLAFDRPYTVIPEAPTAGLPEGTGT